MLQRGIFEQNYSTQVRFGLETQLNGSLFSKTDFIYERIPRMTKG